MPQGKLLHNLFQDWDANSKDPKSRTLLLFFRMAQWSNRGERRSYLVEGAYRLFSEILLGTELRPKTEVGPGLTVHHGFGLVVNDHTKIGRNVVLRNGVVIGNKVANGPCPILEDNVEVGANAVILGDVTVGHNAIIGAGAVVTKNVPAECIAKGNPATIVERPNKSYSSK